MSELKKETAQDLIVGAIVNTLFAAFFSWCAYRLIRRWEAGTLAWMLYAALASIDSRIQKLAR
ncbi:MAG TPA: hypothetical protein VGR34_06465 [Candidatus Dormibacteraeota bacterium]|nr:hypothetical protein [Candidatus Dormibacteraeota bacterium]